MNYQDPALRRAMQEEIVEAEAELAAADAEGLDDELLTAKAESSRLARELIERWQSVLRESGDYEQAEEVGAMDPADAVEELGRRLSAR